MANEFPSRHVREALTSFVGRERELTTVRQPLTTSRLVTLTATGGIDKTRLAARVASDSAQHGPVVLVELAALTDPDLVAHAIAPALRIPDRLDGSEIERIVEALRTRSCLLVLDNYEHLVDSASKVADSLLRACSDLRILATSRGCSAASMTGFRDRI